jgi:hypothetical protein
MSIPHKIILFFALLLSLSLFAILPGSQQLLFAQDVPSPACLGSCPTAPVTQAPLDEPASDVSDAPEETTTIATTVTPPCPGSISANARRGGRGGDRGGDRDGGAGNQNGGLLDIFFQLITLLLQLLIGGGAPLPTPIPDPTPAPLDPCHLTPTAIITAIPIPLSEPPPSEEPTTQPTSEQPSQAPQPTVSISSPISPLPGNGVINLIYPPGIVASTTMPGYFQLPSSTSGTNGYTTLSCDAKHWGAKELVGVIYTVAQRFRQKYPQGYLRVDDMNGAGHEPGHTTGESADIDGTTNGTDCVADFIAAGIGGDCSGTTYNREATIELAKMFIDTGKLTRIIFLDPTVNAAMDEYAKSKGATRNVSLERPDHDSHFHIDLNIPKLATWAPDC